MVAFRWRVLLPKPSSGRTGLAGTPNGRPVRPYFHSECGSIFVGEFSAQAAGDYASGPNHVCRLRRCAILWCFLLDFVKIITVQELSERGLKESKNVTHLAETEGLHAHSDPFV